MKPKILVTGASGYIGSLLCPLLAEAGCLVTALDLSGPADLFSSLQIDWITGDARDSSLVRRSIRSADILIPLAAIVGAGPCDQDPDAAQTTNFDAIRLLNSLRSRDQWVLYPMTNCIYDPDPSQTVVNEDCPTHAHTLYGRTKLEAEQELLSKGNAASLRFASVFGRSPTMRWGLLLNHFVQLAATQGEIHLFEKDFKRNFIHVSDAAACFFHLVEKQFGISGVFNVGSANLTKQELVEKIKQYFPGLKIVPLKAASDPDQRNFFISCEKIERIGFAPKRTVDEGIQELLADFQPVVKTEINIR